MKYLIGLLFLISSVFSQVTDKNFKDEAGKGVVIIKFTSEWQEKDLDPTILKGLEGYEDAVILEANSDVTKKLCKKLRIRNFPSIALYINGDKMDVWKADMDGEVDCTKGDIKDAIDDGLATEQF
tara:strand:- start:1000 stop:1374 length:375 start_codon:yes stop_codon:yes gene_type:complete